MISLGNSNRVNRDYITRLCLGYYLFIRLCKQITIGVASDVQYDVAVAVLLDVLLFLISLVN